MRSFAFGALLLRTLNAQGVADSGSSASLAPDALTEAQLSAALAAALVPIITTTSETTETIAPALPTDVFGAFSTADVITAAPTTTDAGVGLDRLVA